MRTITRIRIRYRQDDAYRAELRLRMAVATICFFCGLILSIVTLVAYAIR
jgi:hypothetical protein